MGALAEAVYQRAIQDQKDFETRAKIKKFLTIALTTGAALGLTALAISIGTSTGIVANNVSKAINDNQLHLQSVEKTPLVFEEKQVGDCKVGYIETSHQNSVGRYEQDLYIKSTCGDQVSVSKVRERINTSRMKLAENQNIEIKKNNF